MIRTVKFDVPNSAELICGQGTFSLLSIEDLHRAVAIGAPSSKFGVAFSEGTEGRQVYLSGNDDELGRLAGENLLQIGCGHCFVILMSGAFPIQVLPNIKMLPSVIRVVVATGNPAIAIVADIGDQSALLGVADGYRPLEIESADVAARRQKIIRKIGYFERTRS